MSETITSQTRCGERHAVDRFPTAATTISGCDPRSADAGVPHRRLGATTGDPTGSGPAKCFADRLAYGQRPRLGTDGDEVLGNTLASTGDRIPRVADDARDLSVRDDLTLADTVVAQGHRQASHLAQTDAADV
jgi:hypothetical protein